MGWLAEWKLTRAVEPYFIPQRVRLRRQKERTTPFQLNIVPANTELINSEHLANYLFKWRLWIAVVLRKERELTSNGKGDALDWTFSLNIDSIWINLWELMPYNLEIWGGNMCQMRTQVILNMEWDCCRWRWIDLSCLNPLVYWAFSYYDLCRLWIATNPF